MINVPKRRAYNDIIERRRYLFSVIRGLQRSLTQPLCLRSVIRRLHVMCCKLIIRSHHPF